MLETPTTSPKPPGFALVVTLSMLVLLAVIAVGLLGLSAISTRGVSLSRAEEEARANARMALMLAFGQLQQLAGHDTRITAGSNLLDESNVRVTGVWRSWEGTDRDATGKPVPPDYSLKFESGDALNPTGAASEGRFLGWLASPLADGGTPDVRSLAGLHASPTASTVPLVSAGSVADPSGEVHVTPTLVDNSGREGAFAWWVSGDNAKAMLNVDRGSPPSTPVAWHTRMKSNGRADVETFGLGALDELPGTVSVPSSASLELVGPTTDIRRIHDLTAFSRGLLTNAATGGWRRDLSLLSENYDVLPKLDLPSYTPRPGVVQTFSKARDELVSPWAHPPNALLYPWAHYFRLNANTGPWRQVPPINSWSALTDFMLQYRYLTSSSSANTAMPFRAAAFDRYQQRFEYQEQVRRSPVIARIQWIFSLCSRPKPDPADPTNTHQASLLVTPVLTLWNPYNVELHLAHGYRITFDQIAPLSFRFRIGDTLYPDTTLEDIFRSTGTGEKLVKIDITTPITLAPGATRIFGLNDNTPVEDPLAYIWNRGSIVLVPGYKPNGGFMFYGLNKGADVYGKATDTFAVEEFAFNGLSNHFGQAEGLGIYMEFWPNARNWVEFYNGHRMIYDKNVLGGDAVVDALYPTVSNAISSTLGEVVKERNKPFVGAIFGFKPATPRPREAKFNRLHTKGLLNSHPLCFYSEVGAKAALTGYGSVPGTGSYHPINAPFEFSFQDVNGWNDTQAIPQFEPLTNSGYIISGLTAGDGLTRCVMAELPTRPLQSLAELQHFDARNNNPIPPFQFNLIGNGSANPIFAPAQISVGTGNTYCNDDSYILNHLLFDDWFVSSIAPDLNDFSRTERRSIERVYQDHLDSSVPLPNRFYLPATGADPGFSVTSASQDAETGMFAYETIASQLEVEGMININSVSLDAWKAWLRQGRDARVPYLAANGSTGLDAASSFAFPRTTIAGDSAAGASSSGSNPLFRDASEFSGYRVLTDDQIDALAEEIVSEIRKRGPFLSLSEFVNRRLTNDKSLALAGTIQQALDTLAKDPSPTRNPYAKIQDNAIEITAAQPGPTDHKFPEAALGSSAFGVPGWTRQADILTRLAPMLSVRDDTFTIRAYGDSRDGNNRILARAWCEVVVCRRADYVDSSEPKQVLPFSSAMTSQANQRFGRRFEIVSFRWLHASEV